MRWPSDRHGMARRRDCPATRPSSRRSTPTRNRTPITAKIAQPWRWLPTMRPNTLVSAGADREDQQHLDQVGQRAGILERMRRVGVEEAAAVGAQHLDDFLRGHRSLRDDLLGAFQRGRLGVGGEVLRHAAGDQHQRRRRSRSAAGCRARSGSDRPRSCRCVCADRRAKPRISAMASTMPVAAETKLCTVSAAHLRQVAHRRLGHVRLPVGVGHEADRGVEREVRRHRGLAAAD